MKNLLIILIVLIEIISQTAKLPEYLVPRDERILKASDKDYVWWPKQEYILEGDLIIERGATLRINPGTVIKFIANTDVDRTGQDRSRGEILVYGEIDIQGEAGQNRVSITSIGKKIGAAEATASSRSGDWYGIVVYKNKDSRFSRIKYTKIEYAHRGISIIGASPRIENNEILYSYNSGIYVSAKSKAILFSNIIQDNSYAGVEVLNLSEPKIFQNVINNNEYGIMIYDQSKPNIGTNEKGDDFLRGENTFFGNLQYDIYNISSNDIYAQRNHWGNAISDKQASNIYSKRIYDNSDNSSAGKVVILPLKDNTFADQLSESRKQIAKLPEQKSVKKETPVKRKNTPKFKSSLTKLADAKKEKEKLDNQKRVNELLARNNPPKKSTSTKKTTTDAAAANKANEEATKAANDKKADEAKTVTNNFTEQSKVEPFLKFLLDQGTGQVTKQGEAVYSGSARDRNIKGRVRVRMIVGFDGKVEKNNITVLKSDHIALESLAMDAAKQYRFTPGQVSGQVVRFVETILVSF
jgi:TonB family protein